MSNLLKDRLRPAKSLAAVWAALAVTAIAPVAVSAQTTVDCRDGSAFALPGPGHHHLLHCA